MEIVLVTPRGAETLRLEPRKRDEKQGAGKDGASEVQRDRGMAAGSKMGASLVREQDELRVEAGWPPETIEEYYEKRKKLLDRYMRVLVDTSPLPRSVLETALDGGKRLRGVMVLLVAESLGAPVEHALPAAAAIEIAHGISLDLDDIVDGDEKRRAKPAAWIRHGIARVVLGGYGALGFAGKIVAEYGPAAVKEWFNAWTEAVIGEIKDVMTQGAYEAVVSAKTATFWGLAATLGAIAANKYRVVPAAREYGRAVGIAYQIADDICDILQAIKRGGHPRDVSAKLFLVYIGLKSGIRIEDAEKNALKKLDEWISRAQSAARKLGVDARWQRLLEKYPAFAADLMLEKCAYTE